ncbi:hypothetical protein ACWGH5_36055 [Streptomyces sp. NPDC054864]
MDGEEPWLGHDTEPRVEHAGSVIRLWPDADRQEGAPIAIPRGELRELLGSVQDDLSGFLKAVERWASTYFADVAVGLVSALDEAFVVSVSLADSP